MIEWTRRQICWPRMVDGANRPDFQIPLWQGSPRSTKSNSRMQPLYQARKERFGRKGQQLLRYLLTGESIHDWSEPTKEPSGQSIKVVQEVGHEHDNCGSNC